MRRSMGRSQHIAIGQAPSTIWIIDDDRKFQLNPGIFTTHSNTANRISPKALCRKIFPSGDTFNRSARKSFAMPHLRQQIVNWAKLWGIPAIRHHLPK
jgi:hypothetical protein